MIFQITMLWLTLALSITSQQPQTAVCTQSGRALILLQKKGHWRTPVISFKMARSLLEMSHHSGKVNQMCVTKIYFQGGGATVNNDPDGGSEDS